MTARRPTLFIQHAVLWTVWCALTAWCGSHSPTNPEDIPVIAEDTVSQQRLQDVIADTSRRASDTPKPVGDTTLRMDAARDASAPHADSLDATAEDTTPDLLSSDTDSLVDSESVDSDTPPPDIGGICEDNPLPNPACSEEASLALYKAKIEPIITGEQPQSCNQCHLAGMDLGMYAKGSACQTMACLVAAGLVDFEHPEDSKVLEQILKAEPTSELITAEVIQAEYDAFFEWITYSALCHCETCGDPALNCNENQPTEIPPDIPTPLGGCDEVSTIQAFSSLVMKWQGRCHGCHSDCDPEYEAPCWLVESLYPDDPKDVYNSALITMYNVIGMGAIDAENPHQSLFLRKPMKEAEGGLWHGGGDKFVDYSDEAYQDYVLWLEGYANCHQGIMPHKPVVSMITPNKYEKKWLLGEATILHAIAIDPQDGELTGETMIWTSDAVDAPLGVGKGPLEVYLPAGKQIIEVTAIDSDGHIGTRALKVFVKE